MANPFGSETADYGTLTGRSSGFRGRDEFASLQQSIGNAIHEIRRSTQSLRSLESQIGTLSDSEDVRRRIQGTMRLSMAKVKDARTQLNDLLQMVRNSTDKGQQLAAQKVQQSFSEAVNEFQNMSQRAVDKLQENPDIPRVGTPQSAGFMDSGSAARHEESARLLRDTPDRAAQQQEFMVSHEAAYIEERAERMEELENDIVQLNDIMGEIGQLVAVQGEQIDTIEGHVETTAMNVNRGNRELESGVKFKKCSRKLTCCIVITVAVFVIILLIIAVIMGCVISKKC